MSAWRRRRAAQHGAVHWDAQHPPDAQENIPEIEEGEEQITPTRAVDPIPEVVSSIVSDTDDPNLPVCTIRVAILGMAAVILMARFTVEELFVENSFQMPMILILLLLGQLGGTLMAAILPVTLFKVPRTQFVFSLNPGPFNQKEHTLIGVCTYIGLIRPNLITTVATAKKYFGIEVSWLVAYLMILSSYFVGFLIVGMVTDLVSSPQIWWPTQLLDVVFFRTWNEEMGGSLWKLTKRRLFFVVVIASCILQMIPSYVFPSMSALSTVCWIWKDSVIAHQIGSGLFGLGLLSFSLNWNYITDFCGDPLAIPRGTILNATAGYCILMFLLTPLIHWSDWFDTHNIPILSTKLFDKYGNNYNISRILNSDQMTFNQTAIRNYSPIRISAFLRASYAMMFASVFVSVLHIVLRWGKYRKKGDDIYNKLMESYSRIPITWFLATSGMGFVLAIICSLTGFGPHSGFTFLAVLAALISAFIVVGPLAIILGTTGQMIPINAAFNLIGGYLFPNKPFEFMVYRTYAYQSATNAVQFTGFLKLGQYMKIAPKVMYSVVIAASVISCTISFQEAWSYMNKTGDNCAEKGLPTAPTSTCFWLDMFHNLSNLWTIMGTRHFLSGTYGIFVLVVVIISTAAEIQLSIFPRQWQFRHAVNMPIILAAPNGFPATTAANFNSWVIAGLVLPDVASRYVSGWSPAWQYLFSIALEAGTGLAGGLISPLLSRRVEMPNWWGSPLQDHCRLAQCPTSSVADCR